MFIAAGTSSTHNEPMMQYIFSRLRLQRTGDASGRGRPDGSGFMLRSLPTYHLTGEGLQRRRSLVWRHQPAVAARPSPYRRLS